MEILFPHEKIRKIQDDFIKDILVSLKEKKPLLAHAPTGLGKSAAILSTTVPFAIKNNLTVFFLTSRHTQHKIAVDTLKKIKEKHNPNLRVVDLIGKRHMCPAPGAETLTSQQFNEYCREAIEKGTCHFHENVKRSGKITVEAREFLSNTKSNILSVDELISECKKYNFCPYEIAILKSREANVIIMDYYHIFSPSIAPIFLKKSEKELEKSIIIVDEAHNLPSRMMEHFSDRITLTTVERAIKEAMHYEQIKPYLNDIRKTLIELSENIGEERIVKKNEFSFEEETILELEKIAEVVRDIRKRSYIGTVASFLKSWEGQDEGFTRIITKSRINNNLHIELKYLCLDPSLASTEVIDTASSIICMSGTLTPLEMYSDLLGFKKPLLKTYPNPFPVDNRLSLIVPKTSTKFTKRSMGMYQDIAKEVSSYVNTVPGNSIIFFPSYKLRDSVDVYFRNLCTKTTFYEQQGITKPEKEALLENFKKEKDRGAVLLAVLGGNFGEGIDLPGDLLKAVIIVGLPLSKPDLETTELINYYDKKFSKGWEYGYIFPAMQKVIQAAGRCIRSETDKGVIIYLDDRYSWNSYYKCFPPDFNLQTTMLPLKRISDFFKI